MPPRMPSAPFSPLTTNDEWRPRPKSSMARACSSQSSTLAGEPMQNPAIAGLVSHNATSRSESGSGNGRRSMPSTTLKIAVLAPMPRARVSTATTENPGLLATFRTA